MIIFNINNQKIISVNNNQTSFFSSRLQTTFAGPNELRKKPPVAELGFGKHFTDHMLTIKWTPENGWEDPQIGPLVPFQMHPAAKVYLIHHDIMLYKFENF